MKNRPSKQALVLFVVCAVVSLAVCVVPVYSGNSIPFFTAFPGLGLLLALGVLFLLGLRLHSMILMLFVAAYVVLCVVPQVVGIAFLITPLFFIGAWIGEFSTLLMQPFFLMGPYGLPALTAALLLSSAAVFMLRYWWDQKHG